LKQQRSITITKTKTNNIHNNNNSNSNNNKTQRIRKTHRKTLTESTTRIIDDDFNNIFDGSSSFISSSTNNNNNTNTNTNTNNGGGGNGLEGGAFSEFIFDGDSEDGLYDQNETSYWEGCQGCS